MPSTHKPSSAVEADVADILVALSKSGQPPPPHARRSWDVKKPSSYKHPWGIRDHHLQPKPPYPSQASPMSAGSEQFCFSPPTLSPPHTPRVPSTSRPSSPTSMPSLFNLHLHSSDTEDGDITIPSPPVSPRSPRASSPTTTSPCLSPTSLSPRGTPPTSPREFSKSHRAGPRQKAAPAQVEVLEKAFGVNPLPSRKAREFLAHKLGMTHKKVQIWFQNRRAKQKRITRVPSSHLSPPSTIVNRPSQQQTGANLLSAVSGAETTDHSQSRPSIKQDSTPAPSVFAHQLLPTGSLLPFTTSLQQSTSTQDVSMSPAPSSPSTSRSRAFTEPPFLPNFPMTSTNSGFKSYPLATLPPPPPLPPWGTYIPQSHFQPRQSSPPHLLTFNGTSSSAPTSDSSAASRTTALQFLPAPTLTRRMSRSSPI